MKFALVAAIFTASAIAQSVADIPKCAVPCIERAVQANTKCSLKDIKCICKAGKGAFDSKAASCVIDACGRLTALRTFTFDMEQ